MVSSSHVPQRIAVAITVLVVAVIGARAAHQQFAEDFTLPPEPTQLEKLVAKLAPRAECDSYRAKLLAQAGASPTSGATQYAIAEAWAGASRAGCIAR